MRIPLLALLAAGCVPAAVQFAKPARIDAGRGPTNTVAGDVNNDGKIDLVTTRGWGRGEISVLIGRGDGTFADSSLHMLTQGPPQSPKLIDLDGDKNLDLVVLDFALPGQASVLLGRGDGTFGEPTNVVLGASATSMRATDLNGDGKIDLVAINVRPESNPVSAEIGGKLVVALGHGDGTFEPATLVNIDGTPRSLACGDWDGDGKIDAMVASGRDLRSEVLFYRGRGEGHFDAPRLIPTRFDATGVSPPSDLNKDGKADLLVSVPGGMSIYLADGNGGFRDAGDVNVETTRSSWVEDFDKDGNLDIVTSRRLLRGDGTGHFTETLLPHDLNNDSAVEVADLNGDGWVDIVATDLNRNAINVYLNRGGSGAATASR